MANHDSTQDLIYHSLFNALTRPAVTAGVPFKYHGLNLMVSVIALIISSNLLYLLLFVPIHVFGWVVCRYDVQFFAVAWVRLRLPNMPNQRLWGVRCYEPY